MKAYKATYNFKCRNQEYKVGKTYTSDKMKMCSYGIHFCESMSSVIGYYPYKKDFILLEIEVLGNVDTDGDKSVTDKMKVLRVVPFEEYTFKNNLPNVKYDEKGNMISQVDSTGKNKITWEYDERGNMISKTYAKGYKVNWEYNDKGNPISQMDSNGNVITWEYDEKGNMISQTDHPSGYKITCEYDEKGNLISQTFPDGNKYTFKAAIITESDD